MALSASFAEPEDREVDTTATPSRASPRRRCLHLLYLLNDLLHHTRYHNESSSAFSTLTGTLQPHLVDLFHHTASYPFQKYPKHHERVGHLLDLWERHGFYNTQYINKLRKIVENAASLNPASNADVRVETNGNASTDSGRLPGKDAPFMMPAMHGDPSTAYYDLPAANMMPHIVPNAAIPINPKLVRPLQFVAGPADESLVTALKDFMKDVESIGSGVGDLDVGNVRDVDELGQLLIRNLGTGEIVGGDGYYGWSRSFCQKMKRRKAGKDRPQLSRQARSDSSERDVKFRKRSRYGNSDSGSNESRSRGRSKSFSRSRSGPPSGMRSGDRGVSSRSRNHSRGRSGSRSPPRRYRSLRSRSRSTSRSRSKSYSPPRDVPSPPTFLAHDPRAIAGRPPGPSPALPPPFPGPFGQGFPLGPGGIPIPPPPPPPPNHTGMWPPPPPPIISGMSFIPPPGQFPHFPGFAPPIPPPPSGPRAFHTQGPPVAGPWGQQQQQGGHNGYSIYGLGGSQAGVEQSYNSRGRGEARGSRRFRLGSRQ